MLCPFCLEKKSLNTTKAGCFCGNCREEIHGEYIKYIRRRRIPQTIISAVGFRGHGKTVFFHSYFYALKETITREYWEDVYFQALDKNSLVKLWEGIDNLAKGILPEATPAVFARPTILKFSGLPDFGDRVMVFYDTSGEVFADPDTIPVNARFLARSPVILFLVSISDLMKEKTSDTWQDGLAHLLNAYIIGVTHASLRGNPRKQDLVVVLTKGDEILDMIDPSVSTYLETGPIRCYSENLEHYTDNMEFISMDIRNWLRENNCQLFLNTADDTFKNVRFTIVSSLGTKPVSDVRMIMPDDPKRIFDPILWMMRLQSIQPKWWNFKFRKGQT